MTQPAGHATVEIDIRMTGISMGKGTVDIPVIATGVQGQVHLKIDSEAFAKNVAAFLREAADVMEQEIIATQQERRERNAALRERLSGPRPTKGGG